MSFAPGGDPWGQNDPVPGQPPFITQGYLGVHTKYIPGSEVLADVSQKAREPPRVGLIPQESQHLGRDKGPLNELDNGHMHSRRVSKRSIGCGRSLGLQLHV